MKRTCESSFEVTTPPTELWFAARLPRTPSRASSEISENWSNRTVSRVESPEPRFTETHDDAVNEVGDEI